MGGLTGDLYETHNLSDQDWKFFNTSYILPSNSLTFDDYNNDPFFELFDCSSGKDYEFTCYKFQPEIGNAVDGMPRFDPD